MFLLSNQYPDWTITTQRHVHLYIYIYTYIHTYSNEHNNITITSNIQYTTTCFGPVCRPSSGYPKNLLSDYTVCVVILEGTSRPQGHSAAGRILRQ